MAYGFYILCCSFCRGPGIDPQDKSGRTLCRVCKGSGYPPGYIPPTDEEIMAYINGDRPSDQPTVAQP